MMTATGSEMPNSTFCDVHARMPTTFKMRLFLVDRIPLCRCWARRDGKCLPNECRITDDESAQMHTTTVAAAAAAAAPKTEIGKLGEHAPRVSAESNACVWNDYINNSPCTNIRMDNNGERLSPCETDECRNLIWWAATELQNFSHILAAASLEHILFSSNSNQLSLNSQSQIDRTFAEYCNLISHFR